MGVNPGGGGGEEGLWDELWSLPSALDVVAESGGAAGGADSDGCGHSGGAEGTCFDKITDDSEDLLDTICLACPYTHDSDPGKQTCPEGSTNTMPWRDSYTRLFHELANPVLCHWV
jgi:hypothetical protein